MLSRTTGTISLRIIYGYEIQEEEDLFVELAEKAMYQFSLSIASGRFLVNLIPSCKLLDLDLFTSIKCTTCSALYSRLVSGSRI